MDFKDDGSSVREIVEQTPPELLGDIMKRGIVLAGGGSLIRGIERLVSEQTDMPVRVMDDPLTAVVRGTGIILEHIDELKDVLTETQYDKVSF